jgi:prepilin-type N-terminal cleavage/methylation domain-containing protein
MERKMISLILKNRFQNKMRSISGFTMLEMMIIVVIIGIVSAIAVPTLWGVMPRLRARSEARAILNKIREARSRAISDGIQVGVHYDSNTRDVFIFKDYINPLDYLYEEGEPHIGPTHQLDVRVNVVNSNFIANTLVFLPDGQASQSGTMTISAGENGPSYTISVIGPTGRAKVS